MSSEYRLYGPPGTGKTTTLASWIAQAAHKFGSDRVFVASFTKTAAAELAGRELPLDKGQVGTLHAHAFRALGRPTIAETKVEEWNEEHPGMALRKSDIDLDDPQAEVSGQPKDATIPSSADAAMAKIQVLRARMVPEEQWFGFEREVWTVWEAWKKEHGYLDFTDLISRALADVGCPLGSPEIGFLDEVQDFTPLELALVRRWCSGMERYVLAGDDDQTLYGFKGATPDAWLFPELPQDQVRVLGQSYRVPKRVHAYAQSLAELIHTRKAKDYLPTGETGAVRRSTGTWRYPSPIVRDIEEHIRSGRRCMVLASCSFFLGPLLAQLRESGVPFHNPYRRNRGDWNPLSRGSDKKRTAVDRLWSLLATDPESRPSPAESWTWGEVAAFIEPMRSDGLMRDGFKTHLKTVDRHASAGVWDLMEWVDSEALERLSSHDLEWYLSSLLPSKAKPFAFPVTVSQRRGKRALVEPLSRKNDWPAGTTPWVSVGTIHSVKGGESDVVYLLPDLSQRGYEQWLFAGQDGKDGILRQFYVGATRAREQLVLCSAGSRTAFPFQLGSLS